MMAALVLRGIAAACAGLMIVLMRAAVIVVRGRRVVVLLTLLFCGGRRRVRAAVEGMPDRGHSLNGNDEQQCDQQELTQTGKHGAKCRHASWRRQATDSAGGE